MKPRSQCNTVCSLLTLTIILSISISQISFAARINLGTADEETTIVSRLDNGMEIVLVPNHSVQMISANVIIKVGARDETWENWGAAHFLEHLLFNGTENRTQEQIYKEFDKIGAYHNAHTGSHFTDFMLLAPSDGFQDGFKIMADMIFSSTLPRWKFEKERGIVKEEIVRMKSYGGDTEKDFREILFGESALSRNVLGTVESIARLERSRVVDFYHDWYVPNNMLLFVTGDFQADTLFDWFQSALAAYPPRELPLKQRIEKPDFSSLSEQGIINRLSQSGDRQLSVAYDVPGPGETDFVVLLMLTRVLDRRLEDDLPGDVRGSSQLILDPDLTVLKIDLSTSKEGPSGKELLQKLDKIIKELGSKPPANNEIAVLARRFLADEVFTSEKLHYYGIMNSGYWSLVSWDEFSSWTERVASVSPGKLSEFAKQFLHPDRRMALVMDPLEGQTGSALMDQRPPMMPPREMATQIDETEKEAEIRREAAKSTRNDGSPTTIVRQDPSSRVFAMHILLKNRWLWDQKYSGAGSVDILHRLLAENRDRKGRSVSERLDILAATLKTVDNPSIPFDNYYNVPDYSYIRFEILPELWQDGVELVFDLLADNAIDREGLKSAREDAKTAVSRSTGNPLSAGRDMLRSHLLPGTPFDADLYGDIDSISDENLIELKRLFFHPDNMIITIAGPTDAQEVFKVVETQSKRLKYQSFTPLAYEWKIPEKANVAEDASPDTIRMGKAQGALLMAKVIPQIDPGAYAAITVGNAYLNDRLGMVLREQQGLAYSLGSSVTLRPGVGDSLWAYWEISIGTRVENISRAEYGIREILSELAVHQFTRDEIERLANSIAGRQMMRDMPRIGQAFAMGVGEFYWRNPDHRQTLIDDLMNITPDQVCDAVRNFFSADGFRILVVE